MLAAQLATFSGHEQIVSEYASYGIDIDGAHFLLGARAEETSYDSFGSVVGPNNTITGTRPLSGGKSYVNVFPNAQLRYALDDETNLRVALTTSIARPRYSDLAPTVSVASGALPTDRNALSAGNPNLKPMTSVNEDVRSSTFCRASDSLPLVFSRNRSRPTSIPRASRMSERLTTATMAAGRRTQRVARSPASRQRGNSVFRSCLRP